MENVSESKREFYASRIDANCINCCETPDPIMADAWRQNMLHWLDEVVQAYQAAGVNIQPVMDAWKKECERCLTEGRKFPHVSAKYTCAFRVDLFR